MGTRKVGQVSFRILELPNLNDECIVNHCLDFPPLGQSIHLTIYKSMVQSHYQDMLVHACSPST